MTFKKQDRKIANNLYSKSFKKKDLQYKYVSVSADKDNYIAGKNSVLEALNMNISVKILHIAQSLEIDDKVKKIISLAKKSKITISKYSKFELDKITDGAKHQGVVIQLDDYRYFDAISLFKRILASKEAPLFVALNGIMDPRNLGAIIRSVDAFGGHGIIIPDRRNVGMTPAAWKTSSGSGLRVPVCKTINLNRTIKDLKKLGCFIIGLDASADIKLPNFELHSVPIVLVIGSENKGISRLTKEICDSLVSIPTSDKIESLNAGISVSISLYQIFCLNKKIT